jgi:putative nucleotidyltransferase with HDIG domain
MLTRLPVTQLREGMYVHALCGAWLEHDFWRGSFPIDGPRVLERLQRSSVREVWVDVSRSDPASLAGPPPAPRSAPLATGRGAATAIAEAPAISDPAPADASSADGGTAARVRRPVQVDPGVAFVQGLSRAQGAIRQARVAIASIFREARQAGRLDHEMVRSTVRSLQGAVERDPAPMLALLRLKQVDEYTAMHSVAVAALMLRLAQTLDLDAAGKERAATAGLLHDIGKVALPARVLGKPGPLNDAEWALMRDHPRAGHALLRAAGGVDQAVLDAVRHHHERVDGTGYPDGLGTERLSLSARMCAVCDVYDAVTSRRPYKDPWRPADAVRRMAAMRAGHFDDAVFRAFVRTIGAWPDGALVRLRSQRLAIVVAQDPESLRTPVVRAFYTIPLQERIVPRTLTLADGVDAIECEEDPASWDLPSFEHMLA